MPYVFTQNLDSCFVFLQSYIWNPFDRGGWLFCLMSWNWSCLQVYDFTSRTDLKWTAGLRRMFSVTHLQWDLEQSLGLGLVYDPRSTCVAGRRIWVSGIVLMAWAITVGVDFSSVTSSSFPAPGRKWAHECAEERGVDALRWAYPLWHTIQFPSLDFR